MICRPSEHTHSHEIHMLLGPTSTSMQLLEAALMAMRFQHSQAGLCQLQLARKADEALCADCQSPWRLGCLLAWISLPAHEAHLTSQSPQCPAWSMGYCVTPACLHSFYFTSFLHSALPPPTPPTQSHLRHGATWAPSSLQQPQCQGTQHGAQAAPRPRQCWV